MPMSNAWSRGRATPILPVASIERSAAFYRAIGFEVEVYDSTYAFIRAGDVSIDITATDDFDPFVMAGMAYVVVGDADAARAAILANIALPGYDDLDHDALRSRWSAGGSLARISAIEDKPWGMREFALADPDNNLLRIGTSIGRQQKAPRVPPVRCHHAT